MNGLSRGLRRGWHWLLALLLSMACTLALSANPDNVASTLEGCRNNGTITLPNGSGQFICPDAAYTTGNLGKGWNELDLVPYRVTLSAGNAAPASQTYTIAVVLDNEDAGRPGYDVISAPTLNAALSDASCSAASAAPAAGAGALDIPGLGGISKSIFRLWTVTQPRRTTCVYDYYGRLALGSHLFPGSSLHANLALPVAGDDDGLAGGGTSGLAVDLTTSGIGASDVSIPVKQISPQVLAKDMTASQGSDHTWSVVKSPTPFNLSFGDVCAANAPTQLPLQITVTWTKSPAILGAITVVTHVYATNPAARVITTSVTDVIYSGTTPLDTVSSGPVNVPANTANFLVLTHTLVVPAGTSDLNDVATATYTDLVTGITVPGQTQATAAAPVQNTGPELNASASVADTETISGAGLSFSVAAAPFGSFLGGYVAGTPSAGPVDWGTTGETDGRSVTFDKIVYLSAQTVTAGVLQDVANLVAINGFTTGSNVLDVSITSSATVALTIQKRYAGITLGAGERLVFSFHIDGTTATGYSADRSITFTGGGVTSDSVVVGGLAPDSYTVSENTTATFYPAGCNDASCSQPVQMQDASGAQRTVDLTTKNNLATCAGAASFVNEPNAGDFPIAEVRKITFPVSSGNWEFTLYRPDGSAAATATAVAGGPFVGFAVALTDEGTYSVVETLQGGWDLNGASPNNGSNTRTCSITVNFPQDLAHAPYQCTFTNTQRGMVGVVKTVLNLPPSGTLAFSFQLREGASSVANGTTHETLLANAGNGGVLNFASKLIPGNTYQLCESVMPGWMTTLGTFVPAAFMPPDGIPPNPGVDNSTLCADFTVAPGETKVIAVDNSPPPGGRALTIGFWKNWASCKKSGGHQAPVLDQTMALAEPTGIRVGNLYLHGSTANPDVAPDCAKAVSLLSKQNFDGKQRSSDPLFNMAAQLVAAEVNYAVPAYKCPLVTLAIVEANALLTKYGFNGIGYAPKLTAVDATAANNLAKRLDDYNNNRPSACL